MKIFRYWVRKDITLYNTVYHLKAGSNESYEHAESILKIKIALVGKYAEDAIQEKPFSPEEIEQKRNELFASDPTAYEATICEELCESLDEHNIITRNRYGALVLNSDELLFLDIDHLPLTFGEFFAQIFGRKIPDMKKRILKLIGKTSLEPEYENIGFRVYETARGIRLLVSLNAADTLKTPRFKQLCKKFKVDSLYEALCIKQNCCRARLTPKPARIHMKTLIKLRFPYEPETEKIIKSWTEEYQTRSGDFAVCRLLASFGKKFPLSPAVEYHDRITGIDKNLPLA